MNGWDKLIGKPFAYISDDFIVNDDTLMTDGMTVDEISALTSMEFTKVLNNNHTVDILVGMITNNPNTTPYIKKLQQTI